MQKEDCDNGVCWSKESMAEKYMYILDTNVLLHDPESLFAFSTKHVGIPIQVLEELDQFKGENSDRGQNARQVIRHLDVLRTEGSLRQGIHLPKGGIIQVLFSPEEKDFSLPLSLDIIDNLLLSVALYWKNQGYTVQFVSKDINARVKADVLGISSQDYIKEGVTEKQFYRGWIRIQVPAVSLKSEFPHELSEIAKQYDFVRNEYVLVESQHNPYNYRIFQYIGEGRFKHIEHPHIAWPLRARNPQQLMALDLLFNPAIQLVTLVGQAGTGKTFLALLAGLHKVLVEDEFQKMLVSRPIIPLGQDIGFLPGTIEEKLHSWMQPVYDNMDLIVHEANLTEYMHQYSNEFEKNKKHRRAAKGKKKRHERPLASLNDLIHQGKISLEAITFMRGRSIPYQYILIDEVQNLTPHEVKTLISRVGEGSKIVLVGDPYQIDSPYLNFSGNGLMLATMKFKGQSLFGSVYLESSERSELSKLVSELW